MRWLPPAVALATSAVVLGPMLRPGYPLRYDLVTVPRPVLGEDALGLGDRLPRAVPLDGATAALALVLPDAVVTQLLALLALTLAGWGAARLTPAGLPGRLVAAFVALWNPFVLEQLAIGHVPHLFAYGALPWAALCGHRLARGGGGPGSGALAWAGLVGAVALGSLTPGGGVLCVVAALAGLLSGAVGGDAGRWRRGAAGLAPAAALQLPWLVAGVMHPAAATSGADDGLALFALRPETGWGRLVDALGLAGMWNGQSLPDSRATVLAKASTVLVIALALAGAPAVARLWRAGRRPEVLAAAAAAAVGYAVAVLPVLPGGSALLRLLVDAVPGAGLLRDGHRWLALPAIGAAVLAGLAVDGVGRRSRAGPAGPQTGAAAAVLVALLAVATMPDLAGGLLGRLQARHYPADWAAARAVLDRSDDRARVLVLPWSAFRRFPWTGPEPVLDPAPRLLPRQAVVSDALRVGDARVPEEGEGARAAAGALRDGELSDAELRGLDVGWVLVERTTPGGPPRLPPDWRPAYAGPELELLRAPGPLPAAPRPTTARAVGVVGAHLLAVALLLAALTLAARRVTRRYRSRRHASRGTANGTRLLT